MAGAASVGPTRHVLDWFHLSMRVQHVAQAVKGWATAVPAAAERTGPLADTVSRIRWRLWHGQTERALALVGDTLAELDALLEAADNRQARKVATLLRALETYVAGQADLIIDYAAARHRGEPISTATTESTVQRLLHRRMGANQQMRWSPRGAHRMLKVRTAVMNGTPAAEPARASAATTPPPNPMPADRSTTQREGPQVCDGLTPDRDRRACSACGSKRLRSV